MRITTILGTTAVVVATATGLTACGTTSGPSASSAYCKELKADKAYFRSFDGQDPDISKLDDALTRMHSLAASAPAATAADWKRIDTIVTTIQAAMDDAGITFGDLAAMQDGDIPDGVDLEAVSALTPKLEALSGGDLETAAAAIDKHARHSCGFALSAG